MRADPLDSQRSRVFRRPWYWLALVLSVSASAQESVTDEFRVATTQGRQVVVLPSAATSVQMPLALGQISGNSYETASQRIHAVSFEGEIFRASTPLEGKSSWIVFDPSQRKFVQLLPSIRVEVDDNAQLDSIAGMIGASRVTLFETLGFAIIDLPETIHPVEAIARLQALPERPNATIRIQAPRVHWR